MKIDPIAGKVFWYSRVLLSKNNFPNKRNVWQYIYFNSAQISISVDFSAWLLSTVTVTNIMSFQNQLKISVFEKISQNNNFGKFS